MMLLSNMVAKEHGDHAAIRLKQERQNLIASFSDENTGEFMENHTRLLDSYFIEKYESSAVGPSMGMVRNPFAVVALGGYGRGEQCVYSDVDLLFLFDKKVPETTENLVREIMYPLWDIGLEIGHATRSIRECLKLAKSEPEVLTSLLDARFVCGMSSLYTGMKESIRNKVLGKKANQIIRSLIENDRERHARFGDSAFLLEPNLKDGRGGLRDYHQMLWIARIKSNLRNSRDLEYDGYLSHEEYGTLDEALKFVWHVRNRLHRLAGRKCDRLHFEHQIELADAMNYKNGGGQQPVECFLGELHARMAFIKSLHGMFLHEQGYDTKRRKWKKGKEIKPASGLEIVSERLAFVSSEAIPAAPILLLRIFEESGRLNIPLGFEAKRIVRDFGHLADENFARMPEVLKSLERIIAVRSSSFDVLEEMLETGFLQRLVPEFEHIADMIQYDEYHVYPVDRHCLRTVQCIKSFGSQKSDVGGALCSDIYKQLKRRKLLLWAALLHDLGKGFDPEDHFKSGAELATRILSRMGYNPKEIETVSFLIEFHLLLMKTATRRDINEEETAIACARKIKNPERLKMLYLLTVADASSTGPRAWTEWTSALIREFFLKVLNIIERGNLASQKTIDTIEGKKERILSSEQSEIPHLGELVGNLTPRYLTRVDEKDILDHLRLFSRLKSGFVWEIKKDASPGVRTVTICAKDTPGLFSRIAGVFTLNNLHILGADVFTWRNNVALDIFQVKAPPDRIYESERWDRVERQLKDALSGALDLEQSLENNITARRPAGPRAESKPPQVTADNTTSSFFTIIEVFTHDFPGALFRITDTFFRRGLNVWTAKTAVSVDRTVGIFYVRDNDGEKLDNPELGEIQSEIEKKLLRDASCSANE